jgi:hypothetical protein
VTRKLGIFSTVFALVAATAALGADGPPLEPIPVTATSASSLIHGVLADDYPVINGPEVPPLPTPVDPEYVVGGQSAGTSRALTHGSLAAFGATHALGGSLVTGGSARSTNIANDPHREARRSLKQVIRDLE